MGVTCFLCDKSAKPSAFSGPITTAWVRFLGVESIAIVLLHNKLAVAHSSICNLTNYLEFMCC